MSSMTDVLARLETAVAAVGALDWDGLAMPDLLAGLERLETARRRAAAHVYDAAVMLGDSTTPSSPWSEVNSAILH